MLSVVFGFGALYVCTQD